MLTSSYIMAYASPFYPPLTIMFLRRRTKTTSRRPLNSIKLSLSFPVLHASMLQLTPPFPHLSSVLSYDLRCIESSSAKIRCITYPKSSLVKLARIGWNPVRSTLGGTTKESVEREREIQASRRVRFTHEKLPSGSLSNLAG